jgi:hypothetical protein
MSRPTQAQLRRLGASLREIDPCTLEHKEEEGEVRWYLGEGGTELTAWLSPDGSPSHMQLVFARTSVDWSPRGLSTGSFDPKGATAGGRYDPYLLRMGVSADPEVCRAALVLLAGSEVPQALVTPLIEALLAAASSAE